MVLWHENRFIKDKELRAKVRSNSCAQCFADLVLHAVYSVNTINFSSFCYLALHKNHTKLNFCEKNSLKQIDVYLVQYFMWHWY